MTRVSRRQRQREALRALCVAGAVARAVDLAFEHFAAFGPDDAIVALLAEAIEQAPDADHVARRFAELQASRS